MTLALQLTEPAAAKAQLPCLDILTHSFALFPRPKTYNSADANHLRTLWKSTRVGYAATFATPPLRHSATYPPLCFHILMNTFSRSPFLLTSLRKYRGCTPLDNERFAPISPNSSPINNASRHRQRPSGRRPSAQALLAPANLCYILFLGLDRRRSSLSRGARIVSRESSFGSFDLIDRGLLDTHGYHYGTGRKAQA